MSVEELVASSTLFFPRQDSFLFDILTVLYSL